MLHQHCLDRRDRHYQRRNPNSIISTNGNESYSHPQTIIGSVLAPLREQKQKLLRPAQPMQQMQHQPYQQPYQPSYQYQPQQQRRQQQQQHYPPPPPPPYQRHPHQYQYQQQLQQQQQSNQTPPPSWQNQPGPPRSQDRNLPISQQEVGDQYENHSHQDSNSNNNDYNYYYHQDNNTTEQNTHNAQHSIDTPPIYQTMNNSAVDKRDF